jgi:hypothetical protein
MTSRSIIIVGFLAVCGAALWGILAQGRHVSELQAEQKRLESAGPPPTAPPAESHATPIPMPEVPRELLQLRAEVARLSQQQRELSAARQENERLRLLLENRRAKNARDIATGNRSELSRQILELVPFGTPLKEARRTMTQRQFTCSVDSYTNPAEMSNSAIWEAPFVKNGQRLAVTNVSRLTCATNGCVATFWVINGETTSLAVKGNF